MESDLPHIVNLINSVIGVGILVSFKKLLKNIFLIYKKGHAILYGSMRTRPGSGCARLLRHDDARILVDVNQIGQVKEQENVRVLGSVVLWLDGQICD